MIRLVVRNIGPIKSVDIRLNRVNVFVGPQSSGKSTLAKIISFCSWMEKVNDATERTIQDGVIKTLSSYYRMKGYFNDKSVLLYQGENIIVAYNWSSELKATKRFVRAEEGDEKEIVYTTKDKTINPKVLYVPAERNFVSSVPNLRKYTEEDDSLQSFINDWYDAKRHFSSESPLSIEHLGVKYYYNEKSDRDFLTWGKDQRILLKDGSSGLQSVVPLSVLINWMAQGIYSIVKPFSPDENQRVKELLSHISGQTATEQEAELLSRLKGFVSGRIYTHSQFVIEEPEQNLFPRTQKDLLYSLLASINHGRNHRMVLTTHSPYILYALNNAMLAYLVKDNVIDEMRSDISCLSAAFDPSNVSVWQIEDGYLRGLQGKVHATIQDDHGLIRNNFFDSVMGDIMSDFNNMVNFYEP